MGSLRIKASTDKSNNTYIWITLVIRNLTFLLVTSAYPTINFSLQYVILIRFYFMNDEFIELGRRTQLIHLYQHYSILLHCKSIIVTVEFKTRICWSCFLVTPRYILIYIDLFCTTNNCAFIKMRQFEYLSRYMRI